MKAVQTYLFGMCSGAFILHLILVNFGAPNAAASLALAIISVATLGVTFTLARARRKASRR